MSSSDAVHTFFAWAPWVIIAAILVATYIATRPSSTRGGSGAPIGQTFACATCGRRGNREHMIPVSQEGSVTWYCGKCAGGH